MQTWSSIQAFQKLPLHKKAQLSKYNKYNTNITHITRVWIEQKDLPVITCISPFSKYIRMWNRNELHFGKLFIRSDVINMSANFL